MKLLQLAHYMEAFPVGHKKSMKLCGSSFSSYKKMSFRASDQAGWFKVSVFPNWVSEWII